MKLGQVSRIIGKPNFEERIIKNNQSAADIVAACLYAANHSIPDAKKLVPNFKKSDPVNTCNEIYKFIRANIRYEQEPNTKQTAKTLKRVLHPSEGVGDCKHYSIISASICKALGMPVYFRVIDQVGRYNHIYTVVKYPGEPEIIIDGCYPYFNREANYRRKKDIKL